MTNTEKWKCLICLAKINALAFPPLIASKLSGKVLNIFGTQALLDPGVNFKF